ncbi:hypothetical protein LTR95_001910 [Oleoguttula sp. CCFEE 5521]
MSRPSHGLIPAGQRAQSNGSSFMGHLGSGSGGALQSRSSAPSLAAPSTTTAMSRAERFEDEKRRIIESCFNKTDANGQLSESYITHIRIHEDADYPSTPPPPESETKKPRLIIIAVRSTGRVRMHKARENNNGSFSIGKTWNLEELSAIESFSNTAAAPKDEKEALWRSWAGNTGFVVTIAKPYYWQAGTSKEKDFFIASTVKIYRKYTKGLVPELRGFDEKDQALMLGNPVPQQGQQQQQQNSPAPTSRVASESPNPGPPAPGFANAEQNRDGSRYRGSPGPAQSGSRAPSEASVRAPSLQPYRQGQQAGGPRQFASNDQMRSQSREYARAETRPGTSPGPAPDRAPMNGAVQAPQRPYAQMRSESPGMPSASPELNRVRPQSPLRQRSQQPSVNSVPEEAQYQPPVAPVGGAAGGAALFATTRQRWMNTPQEPPEAEQRQSSAPQLPPLETTQPRSDRSAAGEDRAPLTGHSEASSAGVDPGVAAAMGNLPSSFWPSDAQASPAQAVPQIQEPSSPPAPERSRRRPPIESRPSEASMDLRPPPLKQGNRTPDDRSHYGTSQDGSLAATPAGGSIVVTPLREVPPEIKPLVVSNKTEPSLQMPGAFVPSPLGPSPLGSPAQTPGTEKDQAEAEAEATSEAYRPGLGPMIRKRAVADKFKKAAITANAFKPRPGGAAERILHAKAQREGEPDGISAVVPRPAVKRDDSNVSTVEPTSPQQRVVSREAAPQVQVISPSSPRTEMFGQRPAVDGENGVQLKDEQLSPAQPTDTPVPDAQDQQLLEERQVRQPQVKVKRRSLQQEKYLAELGIDRSLLEGRGLEFENILSDFGWNNGVLQPKQLVDLEKDLKRELGRVEAGSWLSHTDTAREERVAQVESLLDKAIAECDELEGLLTLYSVELGSLNEDIAFIEAQSQGLQVQSANQKLLQTELQNLVETMSLDKGVFEALRYGDLGSAIGVEEVEGSLMRLYQAMVTMDPTIRSTAGKIKGKATSGSELSRMAALRENKDVYERESNQFCQRLMQHLDYTFTTTMNNAQSQVTKAPPGASVARLNKDGFMTARTGLWMYSPLILFTKELMPPAWQTILRLYYTRAAPLYTTSFRDNLAGWKRAARKPTGEEADLLFTAQEKEGTESSTSSALTSTARKLTVKRSQTLAKTLRNASAEKSSPSESRNPGALSPSEVFAGAMDEMAPLISQEQNFIVDMFHATSLSPTDFPELASAIPPDSRRGTNILTPKPIDPDRDTARRVTSIMTEIFTPFAQETSALLDWTVSLDPIQGVGVLAALAKHSFYLSDTSQEFLLQTFEQLSSRLQTLWAKFVDEQIRAIEDTKVKIHKRKGVLRFIRVFPHFAAGVENTFASVARADYDGPAPCVAEVRKLVDDAYARINRAMFDSLKIIAKEGPATVGQQRAGDDAEDKEMLNYYILVIENMNHYIEDVDDGGKEGVLAEWRGRAMMERMEALEAYVGRVLRRPLGKLMDFLDSLDSLLTSSPNPQSIASRPSYSRKAARSTLASFDGKEIRRGIDTLRKRIEKHFGDADDEATSRTLLAFVQKECERHYEVLLDRLERVCGEVWPASEGEKGVEVEFGKEDVRAGFRR